MKKRVTKSFLVQDSDTNDGFYCLRGRNLREAVKNALTPRGDFSGYYMNDATVDEVLEIINCHPIFESEAWIWPIEWTKEQREKAMKH